MLFAKAPRSVPDAALSAPAAEGPARITAAPPRRRANDAAA